MSRRTLASAGVLPAGGTRRRAAFLPVPYVTMTPGRPSTCSASRASRHRGRRRRHLPHHGHLRMTTVSVTNPSRRLALVEALAAWLDANRAVYPRDVDLPAGPDRGARASSESSVEMVSSQDTAIAAALDELGYKLPLPIEVLAVTRTRPPTASSSPATGPAGQRGIRRSSRSPRRSRRPASASRRPSSYAGSGTRRCAVTPEASPDDPKGAIVGVADRHRLRLPVRRVRPPRRGHRRTQRRPDLRARDLRHPDARRADRRPRHRRHRHHRRRTARSARSAASSRRSSPAADAGAELFLVPPANCSAALGADVDEDEIRW